MVRRMTMPKLLNPCKQSSVSMKDEMQTITVMLRYLKLTLSTLPQVNCKALNIPLKQLNCSTAGDDVILTQAFRCMYDESMCDSHETMPKLHEKPLSWSEPSSYKFQRHLPDMPS